MEWLGVDYGYYVMRSWFSSGWRVRVRFSTLCILHSKFFPMIPLLNISNLNRSYPVSEKPLFKDFSLAVQQWEFLFLTWKSGAGKTTLTRFITWEIKPPVDTTFFYRQDLARLSRGELQAYRKKIWIVFQDFKLLEWKTIRQNILFPLQIETSDSKTLHTALSKVTTFLDIEHTLDSYPKALSWGEKQRAAIGRALIRTPEFLIMDEPTGNIDQDSWEQLLQECFALNRKWITIIFVTHDLWLIKYAWSLWHTFKHLDL